MNRHEHKAAQLHVSALSQNKPTRFALVLSEAERRKLAGSMNILALKKLRFEGKVSPEGKNGFALSATLGATVVQECIVSLAPVTNRIDAPVTLRLLPQKQMDRFENRSDEAGEMEMPEDENVDMLGEIIDLAQVMAEALALNLPDYPRAEGAALSDTVFADEGIAPLRDEELKPLAGLAALKAKMETENQSVEADDTDAEPGNSAREVNKGE